MKYIYFLIYKSSRNFFRWSNDKAMENAHKFSGKIYSIIADISLFFYIKIKNFGLFIGWIITEPYCVDKAIKNSEDRLKRFIELKAPEVIIDSEREILRKRKWVKHLGYKTMEDYSNR